MGLKAKTHSLQQSCLESSKASCLLQPCKFIQRFIILHSTQYLSIYIFTKSSIPNDILLLLITWTTPGLFQLWQKIGWLVQNVIFNRNRVLFKKSRWRMTLEFDRAIRSLMSPCPRWFITQIIKNHKLCVTKHFTYRNTGPGVQGVWRWSVHKVQSFLKNSEKTLKKVISLFFKWQIKSIMECKVLSSHEIPD